MLHDCTCEIIASVLLDMYDLSQYYYDSWDSIYIYYISYTPT